MQTEIIEKINKRYGSYIKDYTRVNDKMGDITKHYKRKTINGGTVLQEIPHISVQKEMFHITHERLEVMDDFIADIDDDFKVIWNEFIETKNKELRGFVSKIANVILERAEYVFEATLQATQIEMQEKGEIDKKFTYKLIDEIKEHEQLKPQAKERLLNAYQSTLDFYEREIEE